LISTFNWTDDAAQRILRVPAGFMRNKTQERIEELARERTAARRAEASGEGGTTIDLALVEDGIEIGKKMMAEMIATYSGPPAADTKPAATATPTAGNGNGNGNGRGYLNEVSQITARSASEP
jgi:predicted phosphoribosyltransferase